MRKIGTVTNIEKPFLSTGMEDEVRDSLRFIGFKNVTPKNDNKMKLYRSTRVCSRLISSIFPLEDKIYHHLQKI